MRDSFDTYFLGWWLFSGQTGDEKTAFTNLVIDMGKVLSADPALVEEWRQYPFDDKKSIFSHFFKLYLSQNKVDPAVKAEAAKVKEHLKV